LVSAWKQSIKYRLSVVQAQARAQAARDALEAVAFGSVAVTSRALATVGLELTFAQWRVLAVVGEKPSGATVTEVAARLGAEISPVSRLVRRLVRRGLVTVFKDDQDRRVTRVTVSESGRELRETVIERRRELLAEVLAAAGPIEPDVIAALDRIGAAFRRYT
jgi:MarR family transcriptional regulator, organic hydroperoxide resistance regulator